VEGGKKTRAPCRGRRFIRGEKGGCSTTRARTIAVKNDRGASLDKKIFCLGRLFFDFFWKKIKKQAPQTSFHFAAGGGEILVTHPRAAIAPQGTANENRFR
jgi:hypothetical protein